MTNQWALTLGDAKIWADENEEEILGGTLILFAGTNDLNIARQNKTRSQHTAQKTTQTITEKGAKPIIVQLSPVYNPQLRANKRIRDTEILDEILRECHRHAIAKTDTITIYRTKMKLDGSHLSLESADTMDKEIAKTIRENEGDQDQEQEITINPKEEDFQSIAKDLATQLITTTKNIATKLIGQGAESINNIKKTLQCQHQLRTTTGP